MNNKLYILLFILTLQSCLNMTDPKQQALYIESYKSFDQEMVVHFPKKIPANCVSIFFGKPKYINGFNSYTEFVLKIQIASKEKYETLKNQLKKEAKYVKNSTDSCLLIVSSEKKQKVSKCTNFYPIPLATICDYDGRNDKYTRNENCEVAFLDFQSGVFLDNEYLIAKENLPKEWENGYSKGYAFNNKKQTIMYWLIIW